jgi:hypothetical protein
MRVLAARFPDRDRASAVLDRLQQTIHVPRPDVAIAPLGMSNGNDDEEQTLLAGRFPDERLPEITRLVREAGGEIVANLDERLTRPRSGTRQPQPARGTAKAN